MKGQAMAEEQGIKLDKQSSEKLQRLEVAASQSCPGWRMCYRNHSIKDPCSWCRAVLNFLRGC